MIISLIFKLSDLTRRKNRSLEETALLIQGGEDSLLDETLEAYKPFIKKVVSRVCKRYIHETDDEFSVGLWAFHEAIMKYDSNKGSSLLSFSDVIITRKVIDYIRKESKDQHLSLTALEKEDEKDQVFNPIVDKLSIEHQKHQDQALARREEINEYTMILKEYGLTLKDVVKHSPKHEDARLNAFQIAQLIIEREELLGYLREKKRLPMKELEELASVSRKTIERNRKYIIAVTIILSEQFYYLRDYLKGRL
ncbi:RNA polymerase sigma-I factor [Bacillus coahuilensis]|uniref:RNA polymerase sigma-I factor n=1 Tax=Bacillus coahuilensis TaxID=408580 RepID=UPI000A48767D|nr:RNA polymerase sigma-I factor [Bacillus coahuilensis]